jgi:hypothetical protein
MTGIVASAALGLSFGFGAALGAILAAWAWTSINEWRLDRD